MAESSGSRAAIRGRGGNLIVRLYAGLLEYKLFASPTLHDWRDLVIIFHLKVGSELSIIFVSRMGSRGRDLVLSESLRQTVGKKVVGGLCLPITSPVVIISTIRVVVVVAEWADLIA